MTNILIKKPKLGEKLKRFGTGSFDKAFWKKVEDSIRSENHQLERAEERLAPTSGQLAKHFSL